MNNLPKSVLVFFGLVGGLLLIYVLSPPYSPCDAQFEVFQKNQTPYLFLDPAKEHIKKTGLEAALISCKATNNSGGCFALFEKTSKVLKDIRIVSLECTPKILSKSEVRNPLIQTFKFMVQLAWGATPPKSEFERDGWYDSLNKAIFCELKSYIQENYRSEWSDLVDSVLSDLPGAQELTGEKDWRELAWRRSVLSTSCSVYQ